VYVPIDMVHLNLSWPLHTISGYFPVGSNGLASGNSLIEAIAHALWELIERDALARFYQMSAEAQAARRIALESITDADARDLLARYARADVGVGIWDMTSDIRIPAFFCAVVDNVQRSFRPLGRALGFGCHSSSGVALCRALTEAAQSRLTRISGARDDMRTARSSTQAHDLSADVGWRQFSEVASHSFPTLAMDVLWTVEMLRGAGLAQHLFVDLSVPELPVSVVRVIVPGLEGAPDTPGYVAGARCQDVA
jgi:ribosomal protein S12 methylthiotransferase accessory factor